MCINYGHFKKTAAVKVKAVMLKILLRSCSNYVPSFMLLSQSEKKIHPESSSQYVHPTSLLATLKKLAKIAFGTHDILAVWISIFLCIYKLTKSDSVTNSAHISE